MKLTISKQDFDSLPILNQLFWALWLSEKGYKAEKELSIGQVLELSLALTNDLKFETPAERTTFNNALHYDEIFLGWDGNQPLDILFYEVNRKLDRRIMNHLVSTTR
jgi:hypothetical protein